ncbi:MAG: T9SS type A sorting domain-containing protein [Bacteroidetes bacterium]|nr:T9SS type A sorting domain-containing protein [Bacteroidota bacterium]
MKKIFISLCVLVCSVYTVSAQIPNAGFETWDNSMGYNSPAGWDNSNAMSAASSVYTCVQGSPGYQADSYIKLVSKTVSGMGVVPGIAVSGMLDMTNMSTPQAVSGFAFAQRPQQLEGAWQYMAYGSDQGHVAILLTKWNSAMQMRDTVASAYHLLTGMEMSWATFSIPLTYQSLSYPDSAIIVLSASGATPVNNSYLSVDTLTFTGSVAGATGVQEASATENAISVYPNPASSQLSVTLPAGQQVQAVQLTDVTGRVVTSLEDISGREAVTINTSGLARGAYIVKCTGSGLNASRKVIIE